MKHFFGLALLCGVCMNAAASTETYDPEFWDTTTYLESSVPDVECTAVALFEEDTYDALLDEPAVPLFGVEEGLYPIDPEELYPDAECFYDWDCTDNFERICVGTECVECREDADCPYEGEPICSFNRCVECSTNSDCPVRYECSSETCIPEPG